MMSFQGVSKSFGVLKVLDNLSFTIERGEQVYIIGRSGEGKSVVMKHMGGLMCPDEGEVVVDGERMTAFSAEELQRYRRSIGFLFQHGALFDSLTVLENVIFPLREHTPSTYEVMVEKAQKVLSSVGLEDVLWAWPGELSVGEQKRVGLARALICEPRILFYDEPTTGLDSQLCGLIDELILETHKAYAGMTTVVVSHDVHAALRYADRVVMLKEGKVHLAAPPQQFLKSKDPYIREFISSACAADID